MQTIPSSVRGAAADRVSSEGRTVNDMSTPAATPKTLALRLAHSPDSDDAFMFYALATGKVRLPGVKFEHILSDIESLNHAARESKYEVTLYGALALSILPSFRFIQAERDFLLTHDLSSLPVPFIHRLGELSAHREITKLDDTMAHMERVVTGAEKYVWIMADQSVRQSYPHEHPSGVPFRFILPRSIDPATIQNLRARIGAGLQIARMAEVKLTIAMNEKTAAVCFPSKDGRMDFTRGFASEDSEFHRWCADIYVFYWEQAFAGASS